MTTLGPTVEWVVRVELLRGADQQQVEELLRKAVDAALGNGPHVIDKWEVKRK